MKNDYEKVRSSRNELEAILRIRGISKQRFGRILNIKGSTIEKYLDLKDGIIMVQGEDNYVGVEPLSKMEGHEKL